MEKKEWTPNQEILGTIEHVLSDALIPDSEIQKEVNTKLNFIQTYPDFVHYLLYILGNAELYSEDTRSLSGIILKNNITATFEKLTEETKSTVKRECVRLLKDPLKEVRNTVSNVIIALIWKGDISSWPELIPYLTDFLDNPHEIMNESALMTLFKICDEYIIKRNTVNNELTDALSKPISKFTNLLAYEWCAFRKDILRLLNQAMESNYYNAKIIIDIKHYIDCLLEMLDNEDPDIQKYICQAFVALIEYRENSVIIHLPQIILYMLEKTKHEDPEVSLQACEFWLATAKLQNCCDILQPYLERLVPVLLSNMKYSEYELNALRDSMGNDSHIQDKLNDIRPFTGFKNNDSDDEYCCADEESYEHSEILDDHYIGWTLRKCSAASLDALALKFQSVMVPIVLSHLSVSLNHQDVLEKEAAILALGAIADGCIKSMDALMPQILNHLLSLMKDECSVVRVITCWTVSRYVSWIMNSNEPAEAYFIPVMTELVLHFMDNNKRVQRAAISAFCIFQEEACLKLVTFIEFILRAFVESFSKLQYRSHMLIYDAIGVLAHSVGNNLNKPYYIEILMPSLIKKFNEFQNYNEEQFLALIECLSNVAQALELGFLPYTEPIFIRCVLIIQETLSAVASFNENPAENEIPDKEPMIVAHDMLLSLAISLKSCFVKYVTNSNLLLMLHCTMQDEMVRVRTPAIALFGELIKICYPFLSTNINEFIPIIIKNLNKHNDGACNNAAWVIGRLCIAMGPAFQPYINEVLECYSSIMENPIGSKAMYQTVAISVCTLGLVFPDVLAPVLNLLLCSCCLAMRNVSDCEEKELGFRGLCQMILHNPNALQNDFIYFCDAVASWNEVKSDLKQIIQSILLGFKEQVGEDYWMTYYEQFPPQLKMRLNKLYEI